MARTKEEILAEWEDEPTETTSEAETYAKVWRAPPGVPTLATTPTKPVMSPEDAEFAAKHGGWTRAEMQAKRIPGDPDYTPEPAVEETYAPEQNTAQRAAKTYLTPEQRVEIIKYHNSGCSPQEIADMMRLSLPIVRTFVNRNPACKPINRTKHCTSCGSLLVLVCLDPNCRDCHS